ncbi:hypothetical protein NYF20_03085 [Lactobacillus delbrueckii]|uniref:hypothetical protein n=1 Tax=Lactobacillus delbrueckii TaxID=1584 RepID=UPI0039C0C740
MLSPSNKIRICTFLCQESIKSAIDKARKALQYTDDDLTQLYHVFDESVREKYVNRDYVLTHFQEAMDKRWIKPYYQMEIHPLTLRPMKL